jgi:TonB family protein
MAMAKGADVTSRVDRILDEARPLFPPLTRTRFASMALAALPVVYFLAVVRPAHVQAQQPARPAASTPVIRVQSTAPLEGETKRRRTEPEQLGREAELEKRRQQALEADEAARQRANQDKLLHDLALTDLQRQLAETQYQIEGLRDMYTEQAPALKRARAHLAEIERDLELTRAGLIRNNENQAMAAQYFEQLRKAYQQLVERSSAFTAGPRLLTRRDPEYTPQARAARVEGTVELVVTIGTDGVPADIQVTRALGSGLDEKAVECVKQWRFQAATHNGEPVTAFAHVEVPFHL